MIRPPDHIRKFNGLVQQLREFFDHLERCNCLTREEYPFIDGIMATISDMAVNDESSS